MLPPFDSRGEGPAVLFAHGSEMDRTMFAPQLEHLGAAGFRAVAFDHRARGEAGHSEYSLYDLAEDARELLDQLQIERCILVGMSMGGFVALRAAIRFPERLAGVVLLGGAMHRAFEAGERERWLSDYEQLRDHEEIPAEFAEGQAAICFSERTRKEAPELVSAWVERWKTNSGEAVYYEGRSWIGQDDITEDVRAIAVPTLIIQGNEDAALPVADALSTFDLMENATMVRLPEIGHTANLEAPDAVNRLIERFAADLVEADPLYG